MFDVLEGLSGPKEEDREFELLQQLERNTSDSIRKARSSERIALKCAVVIEPGNSSELSTLKIRGMMGNISEGGCQVLLPMPLRVGDIYRVTFDGESLNLPMAFARCLRCRLIREDAFESGLSFFKDLNLGEQFCSNPI